jgi:curved DNA-binding protein CbpA
MELRKIPFISSTALTLGHISTNTTSVSPFQRSRRLSISASLSPTSKIPQWPLPADVTPYNVLGLQPGQAYSKARYYELVKFYHPDRFLSVDSSLPGDIRAQRYKLVVAAHEILRDPRKRSEYDRYGAGWTSPYRTVVPRHTPDRARDYNYTGDWGSAATAFDFRKDLHHQRLALLVIVIAFFLQSCLFVVQCYKAEIQNKARHNQWSKLIESRRRRASSLGLSEAQVENFLLKRDPSGMGFGKLEEPVYREALPYCTYGGLVG